MDHLTYNGEWHREPLGSFNTGPPYIKEWNRDIWVRYILCTCSYNFADPELAPKKIRKRATM